MGSYYFPRFLKYHLYQRWRARHAWNAAFRFETVARRLRPGDVAIDAGANLGIFTEMLAGTGATVHAFEPDPHAFKKLEARVGDRPNVRLHRLAVSDRPGMVRLFRSTRFGDDPDYWSMSSSVFAEKANVSPDDFIEVEQISLTDFIRDLREPVRLLKIDIEGAEVPVLEAIFGEGLMDRIGYIFAETHEKKIPHLAERTAALRRIARLHWSKRINLDWE